MISYQIKSIGSNQQSETSSCTNIDLYDFKDYGIELPKTHILVVDDEPFNLKSNTIILKKTLSNLGYYDFIFDEQLEYA